MENLDAAFGLDRNGDELIGRIGGDHSNGMVSRPPESGFPFGGLLAALCARAMRDGLGLAMPLRSLSVQYLAAPRFDTPTWFRPRLLRGGRATGFASVEAGQDERLTNMATATYGLDTPGEALGPLLAPPPALAGLDPSRTIGGPMAPRFSQHVDYVFESGPHILGGNIGRAPVERLWMRTRDAAPLDELRLCYLLDALYPPAWTLFRRPPAMASVDLRYDILAPLGPETAPDGWVFFEFRLLDHGLGWSVDETTAWTAEGTALAVSRQRRRLAPVRQPRDPTSA